MKTMTNRTKGMVLKMIQSVWGGLKTKEARAAWAKGQAERNSIEDQIFRHWIISQGIPEDIARKAWEQGDKARAIAWLRHPDRKSWIEYYQIGKEVNAAFQKLTPQ